MDFLLTKQQAFLSAHFIIHRVIDFIFWRSVVTGRLQKHISTQISSLVKLTGARLFRRTKACQRHLTLCGLAQIQSAKLQQRHNRCHQKNSRDGSLHSGNIQANLLTASEKKTYILQPTCLLSAELIFHSSPQPNQTPSCAPPPSLLTWQQDNDVNMEIMWHSQPSHENYGSVALTKSQIILTCHKNNSAGLDGNGQWASGTMHQTVEQNELGK